MSELKITISFDAETFALLKSAILSGPTGKDVEGDFDEMNKAAAANAEPPKKRGRPAKSATVETTATPAAAPAAQSDEDLLGDASTPAKAAPAAKPVTIDDLRPRFLEFMRVTSRAKGLELLVKYSGGKADAKLVDVKPENYAAISADIAAAGV